MGECGCERCSAHLRAVRVRSAAEVIGPVPLASSDLRSERGPQASGARRIRLLFQRAQNFASHGPVHVADLGETESDRRVGGSLQVPLPALPDLQARMVARHAVHGIPDGYLVRVLRRRGSIAAALGGRPRDGALLPDPTRLAGAHVEAAIRRVRKALRHAPVVVEVRLIGSRVDERVASAQGGGQCGHTSPRGGSGCGRGLVVRWGARGESGGGWGSGEGKRAGAAQVE